MTRINVILPIGLCRQHAFAEYRELPRIFTLTRLMIRRGDTPHSDLIPPTYRLGAGHMLFFTNKLKYLQWRHRMLRAILTSRWNYKLPPYRDLSVEHADIPMEWWGWYHPTPDAIHINTHRLIERLSTMTIAFKDLPVPQVEEMRQQVALIQQDFSDPASAAADYAQGAASAYETQLGASPEFAEKLGFAASLQVHYVNPAPEQLPKSGEAAAVHMALKLIDAPDVDEEQ